MKTNVTTIIEQIDNLLQSYEENKGSFYSEQNGNDHRLITCVSTRLLDGINRFSPIHSSAIENAQLAIEAGKTVSNDWVTDQFAGILKALRDDYAAGYLESVQELIHADLFSDFLEMADHLLDGGYKNPAAVIAGSTLEEHLRKLCDKSGIDPVNHTSNGDKPHKADFLNADLTKNGAYNKLEQKSVTAWLDLRNKAAHGHYDEYDHKQVAVMIQGIRDFMIRNPA